MSQSLEPFIHRKVVVLHETDTAVQAARAMCENQVGCVLISDRDGHITGVVTDRDLACGVLGLGNDANCSLNVLKSAPLVAADESISLADVIELMAKHGVRRIPILHQIKGGHQRCIGLVTVDDLIAAEIVSREDLGRIVRAQIRMGHRLYASGALSTAVSGWFLKALTESLRTDEAQARAVAKFVFGAIVRRLHYTAAVQFIMQTPHEFHLELFDLPPGPERSLDAQYFLTGVAAHLRTTASEARECLLALWATLLKFGDIGKLNHVLSQLPKDIRELYASEAN